MSIKISCPMDTDVETMDFVIEGMRNPMNSWGKSDSEITYIDGLMNDDNKEYILGPKDKELMESLKKAGPEHRKFMRMMPIYMRITAPLYWWKEFDTYKVGTVANSCSTMHKITEKPFAIEDFSHDQMYPQGLKALNYTIETLNYYRDKYLICKEPETKKKIWYTIIQLLPSSYMQTRNVMINYEVAYTIIKQRNNHKLNEWHVLCDVLKNDLEYSFLLED